MSFLRSRPDGLIICLVLSGMGVADLRADAAILTDNFDGTQPKAVGIGAEPGCDLGLFPFFDSGIFQVPNSEPYEVFNTHYFGQAVNVGIYAGMFNAEDAGQNRLALIEYV